MLREELPRGGRRKERADCVEKGNLIVLEGFSKGLNKIQINGCGQDSHAEVQPSRILQKGKNDSTYTYLI